MYMCVQCTCMWVCVYMLVHEHAHLWMTELSPGGLSSRWQLPCIFKIQPLTGNWGSPGSLGELPSSYRNPPASAFRFPELRLQVHVTMPGSCVSSGDPTQEFMLALQACCQRVLSPGPGNTRSHSLDTHIFDQQLGLRIWLPWKAYPHVLQNKQGLAREVVFLFFCFQLPQRPVLKFERIQRCGGGSYFTAPVSFKRYL